MFVPHADLQIENFKTFLIKINIFNLLGLNLGLANYMEGKRTNVKR